MKKTLLLILLATSLPLVVAGVFTLAVKLHGLVRYDAAYFTAPYLERYKTPSDVAIALESALQNDDQALVAELQGLRRPVRFEKTGGGVILVMLWARDEPYLSYLYIDLRDLHRQTHYLEQVNGRWVVSPADIHYYFYSGRWKSVFLPIAIVWWLLELVTVVMWVVFTVAARVRAERYG
ncbi:MAG TPA: hypothetical protein ENN19_10090 [Chloroflexi bacterium]|nr:hypothetical protein [Chloroflexota bacterium]